MEKQKKHKNPIDCLFIGHNEMAFADYEEKVRRMGVHTGAFRDLNLNYIRYNGKPYTASEIFNFFYYGDTGSGAGFNPFTTGETFSATISYLGTYVHRRGFSFDYINSFQDQKDELAVKLENNEYLAAAITTTLYVSAFPIIEIIEFIRGLCPDIRIIVGGPFIYSQQRAQDPASLDYFLSSVMDADFYVIGSQGEKALVEILDALKTQNTDFEHIENIRCKTPGGIRATPVARENNILADNMVDWDLFSGGVGEYVNVRTAISCPYSCSFCGFPQHAGKYQTAPVEAVEQELITLNRIPSLKSVHFIDDTFNIPAKRFKDLLRMMIKNAFKFKWYSHYRCQFADRETIELMKESGCEGVFLGIESGSDRILKNMNKAASVEKYLAGIQLLKESGILTYGSFIIGFPGETEETVKESTGFIRDSGLDFFRAQAWYCDPITPVWEKREQYQLSGNSFEWRHATMDSARASDIVDDIFLSIHHPIWVPQYNFECDALFHLLNRGLSLDRVKGFISAFNNGVREKIADPSGHSVQREVSMHRIEEIRRALGNQPLDKEPRPEEQSIEEKFDADFDF